MLLHYFRNHVALVKRPLFENLKTINLVMLHVIVIGLVVNCINSLVVDGMIDALDKFVMLTTILSFCLNDW